MVMNVDPRGPGAAAGIYQGDIVINWNGGLIRHVQSVLHALGPDNIGPDGHDRAASSQWPD